MSKILIISDSHFLRKKELSEFINQFDVVTTIHCGDIFPGYKPGDITNLYLCKGNNDYGDITPMCHFTVDDITFNTVHGHKNGYAYKPETLINLTYEKPCDVICFGHTHVPYYYNDGNIQIINPGSLTLSRTYPRVNTYVIYDTSNHSVTFYNAKDNTIIEIPNSFKASK